MEFWSRRDAVLIQLREGKQLSGEDRSFAMMALAATLQYFSDQDRTIEWLPEDPEVASETHHEVVRVKSAHMKALAADCRVLAVALRAWPEIELAVREELLVLESLWGFTTIDPADVSEQYMLSRFRVGLIQSRASSAICVRLRCRLLAKRDIEFGDADSVATVDLDEGGPTWKRNDYLLGKGFGATAAYDHWNDLSSLDRERICPRAPAKFNGKDAAEGALREARLRRNPK